MDRVVDKQVTLISREASVGLCQIAEKRGDEVDALKEELAVLEEEAKAS